MAAMALGVTGDVERTLYWLVLANRSLSPIAHECAFGLSTANPSTVAAWFR
jgi:hypothetical protein